MNYKELLKETSSGWTEKGLDWYVDSYCPQHLFKDAPVFECPAEVDKATCNECWDREVPEEVVKAMWEEITKPANVQIRSTEPNEIVDIVEQVNDMDQETVERVAEAFDNANGYIVSSKELKAALDYAAKHPEKTPAGMIKDSGERTEFSSGAVRDMHAGKGRFDVMPMYVIANILNSPVLERIAGFQLTGETTYLYQAIEHFTIDCYGKDVETDTLTQLSSTMLLEVAKHYEEGAIKYNPDNWRRGIPVWCYIDSATRHYVKWRRGDTDEHHERAFIWNLMCCIWEVDYGDEWRKQKGYFNKED